MSNVTEIVLTFVVLWLLFSIARGLAFDCWGIGREPGGERDDRHGGSRTMLQRRKSRLYVAYPFMAVVIVGLLILMLR